MLKQTTNDKKLHWLQFRLLHNILTTNKSVSKFKPNQTDLCEFCKKKSESIQHLLWSCEVVQSFWKDLSKLLNRLCTHVHNFSFNERLVLFGHDDSVNTDRITDLIILLAKHLIYKCKVQKSNLNINYFKNELHQRYCFEKYINDDSTNFKNSWAPFMNIFRTLIIN